jgi:hypothetical protein
MGKSDIIRDVNGAPKPDYPWGIPLLGLGYGLKQIPMGIDLGEIPYPSGMAGTGLGGLNPTPITHYNIASMILYPPSIGQQSVIYLWAADQLWAGIPTTAAQSKEATK